MASIFGIPDSELGKSEFESMSAALTKWGNDTIEKLLESYDSKNIGEGTAGTLRQSMVVLPIKFKEQVWNMSFEAEDYWKFINKGVVGVGGVHQSDTPFAQMGAAYEIKAPDSPFSFKENTKPSYKHFLEWAYQKGLNPFAVRESVFRSGIRATHYFDEVMTPEWTAQLVKRMEKAGAREIEISLGRGFKAKVTGV